MASEQDNNARYNYFCTRPAPFSISGSTHEYSNWCFYIYTSKQWHVQYSAPTNYTRKVHGAWFSKIGKGYGYTGWKRIIEVAAPDKSTNEKILCEK